MSIKLTIDQDFKLLEMYMDYYINKLILNEIYGYLMSHIPVRSFEEYKDDLFEIKAALYNPNDPNNNYLQLN